MSAEETEIRPAATERIPNANNTTPTGNPILRGAVADRWAAAIRGAFVVVVQIDDEKYRRRVFLTLAAAQRSLERAQERGHEGVIMLARLEPVAEVVA